MVCRIDGKVQQAAVGHSRERPSQFRTVKTKGQMQVRQNLRGFA